MTQAIDDVARSADPSDATKTVSLVMEVDLDASIETVWQALTDPSLVARWLLPGGMESVAGRDFRLDGGAALGPIDCTVLESDPPRALSYRWHQAAKDGAARLETVVRFDLAPRPDGGTRLKLVHDGFVVAADRPVDAVAEREEAMIVLLPMAALLRRRPRRARRAAVFAQRALPTVMRLAA